MNCEIDIRRTKTSLVGRLWINLQLWAAGMRLWNFKWYVHLRQRLCKHEGLAGDLKHHKDGRGTWFCRKCGKCFSASGVVEMELWPIALKKPSTSEVKFQDQLHRELDRRMDRLVPILSGLLASGHFTEEPEDIESATRFGVLTVDNGKNHESSVPRFQMYAVDAAINVMWELEREAKRSIENEFCTGDEKFIDRELPD